MSRAAFAAEYVVTDEDLARLDAYVALLGEWQQRMNLVAPSTLGDVWIRHIADSAQLVPLAAASEATVWLDIGSGAGFPALILACLAPGHFHLVEATAKKCAFLHAAADVLGVAERVTVHNRRIETMMPLPADLIIARACAPLTQLLAWGLPFARDRWLLSKGRTATDEMTAARTEFAFDADLMPSRTDPDARIVSLRHVRRRR